MKTKKEILQGMIDKAEWNVDYHKQKLDIYQAELEILKSKR